MLAAIHCFKSGTELQELAGLCTEIEAKRENSQMKGLMGLEKLTACETQTGNKTLKGFKCKGPKGCLS